MGRPANFEDVIEETIELNPAQSILKLIRND
jgi:hypothetical protein